MGAYEELIERVREASLLGSTASLLAWDQETMMPPGGVEYRSRQLSLVARLTHERVTDPRVGELIDACEADADLVRDPHSDSAATLREIRRVYDRATKLPSELVAERAKTRSVATHEWQEARKTSDFDRFRPWLEKNIALARRVAECYGRAPGDEPWDALAEGYEPGMRARDVESVFAPLRDRLQALVSDLMSGARQPSAALAAVELPIDAQQAFVRKVTEAMGFDYDRGRIDVSAHPFCSGTSPGDVRITARYKPKDFGEALAGGMHEAGHALYEQGLPPEHTGTPLGDTISLGLHESQSRMWENFVGRSRGFWSWCLPQLKEHFGDPVAHLSTDDVYESMNRVSPSLIRVEADEATYNLHIMVRFELERALIRGDLDAGDLPHEWNRRYKEYLGVDVPNDSEGCMQDIHWSGGSFGYFPTYTLGNLYAAQLYEQAAADIPGLEASFERGDFAPLKAWLNEHLHRHGGRYLPAELCQRITGKPLSADPLLRHLEGKLRPLYGL